MTVVNGFGRRDLIEAWLSARAFAAAEPAIRDWHTRRYHAMAAAFGVLLEKPGDGPALPASWLATVELPAGFGPDAWTDPGARWSLHHLFLSVAGALESLRSPFDGELEAPAPIVAFLHRHAPRVDASLGELRERYLVLMEELLEAIWGVGPASRVNVGEIRRHGWDPEGAEPEAVGW